MHRDRGTLTYGKNFCKCHSRDHQDRIVNNSVAILIRLLAFAFAKRSAPHIYATIRAALKGASRCLPRASISPRREARASPLWRHPIDFISVTSSESTSGCEPSPPPADVWSSVLRAVHRSGAPPTPRYRADVCSASLSNPRRTIHIRAINRTATRSRRNPSRSLCHRAGARPEDLDSARKSQGTSLDLRSGPSYMDTIYILFADNG